MILLIARLQAVPQPNGTTAAPAAYSPDAIYTKFFSELNGFTLTTVNGVMSLGKLRMAVFLENPVPNFICAM